MAQPARHSERAEKLYPSAIQSSVSEHNVPVINNLWADHLAAKYALTDEEAQLTAK